MRTAVDPAQFVDVMDVEVSAEPFAIDRLVHEGPTIWYGRPEAGKSGYGISLAHAMSSDAAEWLGHEVINAGRAAYLALDPAQVAQTRRRAERIPGASFDLATRRPKPERWWWEQLAEWCHDHETSVLIVDNLARIMPPGKSVKNDDDVAEPLAWLDLVVDSGTPVVLMHHAGKPREDGLPAASPMGATAIEAWARHIVRVDRKPNSRISTLDVKGNDCEEFTITAEHHPDGTGKHGAFFTVLSDESHRDKPAEELEVWREVARRVVAASEVPTSLRTLNKWLLKNPPVGIDPKDDWLNDIRSKLTGPGLLTGGSGKPYALGPGV